VFDRHQVHRLELRTQRDGFAGSRVELGLGRIERRSGQGVRYVNSASDTEASFNPLQSAGINLERCRLGFIRVPSRAPFPR